VLANLRHFDSFLSIIINSLITTYTVSQKNCAKLFLSELRQINIEYFIETFNKLTT